MGTNQQILMDSTLSGGQKFFDRNFSIIFSNDLDEGTVGTVSAFAATNYRSSILDRYIKVLPGISHYEGVTLQAQADGPSTVNNNLSFYSASTNERYTYTQADADEFAQMIDLVFIHHSIYKNTQTNAEMSFQSPNEPNLVTLWQEQLLIPFQYNADNKNTTYFKRLFGVNWDNLDNASIENTIDGIGTDTMIHDLNPEDYIGFMTHTGNYGIIRVTATNPEHNPYTDATITFDVKVQK